MHLSAPRHYIYFTRVIHERVSCNLPCAHAERQKSNRVLSDTQIWSRAAIKLITQTAHTVCLVSFLLWFRTKLMSERERQRARPGEASRGIAGCKRAPSHYTLIAWQAGRPGRQARNVNVHIRRAESQGSTGLGTAPLLSANNARCASPHSYLSCESANRLRQNSYRCARWNLSLINTLSIGGIHWYKMS